VDATVDIAGRQLTLTNLDKVLYPATGTTKADVIDYYRRVAPVLLPHLAGRPPTLVRAPNGVDGERFFEKRCPPHHPDWIATAPVTDYDGCCIDDLAGLVWLANLAALELHTHQWRTGHDHCDTVVIDLDPGPGCDVLDCRRVALDLRAVLERLALVAVVKTSGSKGLHLSVPVNGAGAPHEHTKTVALALGQYLEAKDPERVTTTMAKEQRPGKVFVDWSQNDRHKTTVAPYSLRIRERPTASTPITWDELSDATRADDLEFDLLATAARAETVGDHYAAALELVQQLPDLGRT
jgi:bifunctional non-homologous end joining protein LigD